MPPKPTWKIKNKTQDNLAAEKTIKADEKVRAIKNSSFKSMRRSGTRGS